MPWQIAFAISTVAGIIRILCLRRYSQTSKVPATIPPAASYLFGVLPIGLVAGLLVFPHHISWSWWVLILMAVLSISMAISNWLGFIAASKIAVAPQETIGMITNVSVVLLGWTLLGERLTLPQFVGGGILLIAAILAIWAPTKTKAGDFERLGTRTVLVAIISALLLGIGLVTEKALLRHMEIGGIFLVSWTVQTFGMLLLASKDISRDSLYIFKGKEFRWSASLGLSNGINGAFYIYALYHSNNISLITALGTVALPLLVLGAFIFLKEREHHIVMWLSLVISFIGLIVMTQ